jgi:hypothetical protein
MGCFLPVCSLRTAWDGQTLCMSGSHSKSDLFHNLWRVRLICIQLEKQIMVCYLIYCPPLWSSGQSSFLQIQRSGFGSRRYQIFWEVVGLERGSLSLVSTTEELLERKSTGFGLENREHCCREPSRWPRGILYPQKLALTSPTGGGRSIGVVRSRTQATHAHHRR